jgi:hypothetical protein
MGGLEQTYTFAVGGTTERASLVTVNRSCPLGGLLMNTLHAVGVVLGLLVCTTDATAAIQPSFHLDACSWDATHVVVVSEGDKIDGDVEVLESWKGDLKKGDRITIPALAVFAPEKERVISKRLFERDNGKGLPPSVTCSRMVLFLIRKQEKPEGGKPAKTTWLPAAGEWGGFMVSTAWIEGGQVYAFAQQFNPGPSELISWDMDERRLKRHVDGIVTAQTTLAEAIRGDANKLETAAVTLLQSESEYVRLSVFTELGGAGAKGLPTLRRFLKDDTLLKYHGWVIDSLTKAGGPDVGPELVELVKQELAFWKKVGPGLPKDWWNGGGVERDEIERLRNHYSRAHAAINGLGKLRHAEAREPLTEFHKYWRSLPQLSAITQLGKACDTALESLPRR